MFECLVFLFPRWKVNTEAGSLYRKFSIVFLWLQQVAMLRIELQTVNGGRLCMYKSTSTVLISSKANVCLLLRQHCFSAMSKLFHFFLHQLWECIQWWIVEYLFSFCGLFMSTETTWWHLLVVLTSCQHDRISICPWGSRTLFSFVVSIHGWLSTILLPPNARTQKR